MASLSTNRILNAVLRRICDSDFVTSLPEDVPRREWRAIRQWEEDKHKHNRLEIIGDSVLRAGLCSKLYQDEELGCGIITQLKDVLLSNLVLAMLAERCDKRLLSRIKFRSVVELVRELLERDERGEKIRLAIPRSQFKPIADRYEAVIGALCFRVGMDGACRWVETAFEQLITAGLNGYNSRSKPVASRSTHPDTTVKGKKRKHKDAQVSRGSKRTKLSAGESSELVFRHCEPKKRTIIPDDADIIDLTVDESLDDKGKASSQLGRHDGTPVVIDLTVDDSDEDASESVESGDEDDDAVRVDSEEEE